MRQKIGALIPHPPAEVGHRRLRACAALEEQRLHPQEHRQEAQEKQDSFQQGGRLSEEAPACGWRCAVTSNVTTKPFRAPAAVRAIWFAPPRPTRPFLAPLPVAIVRPISSGSRSGASRPPEGGHYHYRTLGLRAERLGPWASGRGIKSAVVECPKWQKITVQRGGRARRGYNRGASAGCLVRRVR